jgi:hypothetical protein
VDAVTPKDDTTFGKDHDQRPRFGADEIIIALSPHPRSEGHRPHCSETLALTTISFLNFPGAVSTPEHGLGQRPGIGTLGRHGT